MDDNQPALTRPWADLDALLDFVEELRRDGYNVGVKEHLDIYQVLLTAAAGRVVPAPVTGSTEAAATALPLADPDQVRRLIGPILCSTPAEQREFAARFDAWVERRSLGARPGCGAPPLAGRRAAGNLP